MEQFRGNRSTTRRRFLQSAAAVSAGAGLFVAGRPSPASAQQLVFSDDFDSASTIDVNGSNASGYKWYTKKWFTNEYTRPENISVSNSVLKLGGAGGEQQLTALSTAVGVDTSPYVRGSVFGKGGYFEARIAFDYAERPPSAGANPAFWSMAIEHVASEYVDTWYTQWPGQEAGYAHYMELDFMEHFSEPRQSYVCSIHDWSGKFEPFWWYDITNGANNILDVGPVDWSQFHTYSCYWVPQDGDTPGHAQWFFDGIAGPTTEVFWKGPAGNPPLPGQASGVPADPPTRTSFTPNTPAEADRTYAVLDQQRLAVRLTTDSGFPMYVDWVRIYDSTVEVL